jgi:hypothetical protein
MIRKLSWLKDSIIQIVFIVVAIVFTVFIANISISGQYMEYYENKLIGKSVTLARNSALLLADKAGAASADGMRVILDLIFPEIDGGAEIIRYALYDAAGRAAASNAGQELPPPPEQAFEPGGCSYWSGNVVRAFHPVVIDGETRFAVMINIDDTPFFTQNQALSDGLYNSLFRGCLSMASGYLLFSAVSNLKKKKEDKSERKSDKSAGASTQSPLLLIHLAYMIGFAALSAPCIILYFGGRLEGAALMGVMLVGLLLLACAAVHLLRVVLWVVAWFSSRPLSGYAAQTLQFCVFLTVFLFLFCFSMQSSYRAQLELSRQDELRLSSVFASLALSGDAAGNPAERARAMDFGRHNECIVVVRSGDGGFSVAGREDEDVTPALDLFISAWESQSSVTGVRGEYIYGVTVMADGDFAPAALTAVRQPYAVHNEELFDTTVDFLLAMSATVIAFVFLFVELNRLLETLNTPNLKRGRGLRFGQGTRSLMFLATASRYVPLYFFVLMVHEIYRSNPVGWVPVEVAAVLPIAAVLLVMAVGSGVAGWLIRLNSRRLMLLGCVIGAGGFIALNYAESLPALLLLLVLTYTGVSLVYNGLWDFAGHAADTGYEEFESIREHTLSGEYLGGTAGAVIGAMVYDKLGLFAALAVSSGVLIVLAVLIRVMVPVLNNPEKSGKGEYGFFRFFFSGRVLLCVFFLLMPFVLGEYFIEQFSPLYADSIRLSPGAASWNSVLMTMFLAFTGPALVRAMTKRLKNRTVGIIANIVSACGLLLFALMPGIPTMYAASALIGMSIGIGKNVIAQVYADLKEADLYRKSGHLFNLVDSMFGQLAAVLFTAVHAFSAGGEYVWLIAAVVAAATVIYGISGRKRKERAQ